MNSREKFMREKFTPNFKGPTLKQIIKFELISWYGRNFKRNKSKIRPTSKLLLVDLGCGLNFKDGWVHVDFFTLPKLKFWRKYLSNQKPEIQTDFRYPLKCESNSVDGIYSGHTIEHLYPDEAYKFLCEIFRILKHGCWLRINFPDLEKYVNYYLGKECNPEFLMFETGCEAISIITQNYGHHSAWDEKLIYKALNNIGFVNIKKVKFGEEGTDKRLIKEEVVRKWETIVVEAQKPF
jgi:predicted SAM-dependent methyltransferase